MVVHILEENLAIPEVGELSDALNQEVGELDVGGLTLDPSSDEHPETKVVAPPLSEPLTTQATDTPNQFLAEDAPKPSRRQLPQRHTRGIPKPTYEPELSSNVKYSMSHYVSNHSLSESNQSFVNQLSTVSIPNNVQETLADPRWKAAMNEELKSL